MLHVVGGATELTNLAELCRFHHRLVHEGGWLMTFDGVGTATFTSPDGMVVADVCSRGGSAEPPRPEVQTGSLEAANDRRGVRVTPDAIVPRWYGERLDLDLALTALMPSGSAEPLRGTGNPG